ncbi:MAG: hypothetical protein ACRDHS_10065 [Actinomycetota bacterium]
MIRIASRYGVTASAPEVDLRGIVAEKRSYLDRHRDESWQGALREERLTLLEGSAEFVSKDRVRVGDPRRSARPAPGSVRALPASYEVTG